MIDTHGLTIHVDSPTERIARSNFMINGWVAADTTIDEIAVSGRRQRPLSFYERPDVVRTFPARSFVRGFTGKGRRDDFGESGLRLVLRIEGKAIEVEHPLPASPPRLPFSRRWLTKARLAWLSLRARMSRVPSQRWALVLERHQLQRKLRSKIFRREHADALLADFAKTWSDAFFVQIGANDGLTGDPLHGLLNGAGSQWRGLMVEPVAHLIEQLRAQYQSRPGLLFECVAIGEQDGKAMIYRIRTERGDPLWLEQLASLDREVLQRNAALFGAVDERIVSETVECLQVRTLLQRHQIQSIDLLVIDTEGWDWRVLRQFNLVRLRPKLILYEHQHLSPGERDEAHAFLTNNGYEWAETPEGDTIAWW